MTIHQQKLRFFQAGRHGAVLMQGCCMVGWLCFQLLVTNPDHHKMM